MRLPNAEIEMAASTEDSRYTLKGVLLDVEAKRLVATEGHIAAVIPVTELTENDHRGILPLDALKQARKMAKSAKAEATLAVNGNVAITAGNQSATFETVTGTYPNYQAIMPAIEGAPTITLDVDLLLRLAKALDCRDAQTKRDRPRVVSLWVKDAQSSVGVKVTGYESAEAVGVIMPCRP